MSHFFLIEEILGPEVEEFIHISKANIFF